MVYREMGQRAGGGWEGRRARTIDIPLTADSGSKDGGVSLLAFFFWTTYSVRGSSTEVSLALMIAGGLGPERHRGGG